MGQYYVPIIRRGPGKFDTFDSHDYNNGLKLMEHSYIGNTFVDTICKQLYNRPGRLAWVGDYAENDDYFGGRDLAMFIQEAWNDAKELKNRKKPAETDGNFLNDKFVVNLSKNEYVDMAKYIAITKVDNYDLQVHPLPLLTAVGNGRGGGDYSGSSMDYVGSWAGDTIIVTDSKPASGEDISDVSFEER